MFLSMQTRRGISTISLPEKVAGQFWLTVTEQGESVRVIGAEGVDNKWMLKSSAAATFLDDFGAPVASRELIPGRMYPFRMEGPDGGGMVFCEVSTPDRCMFQKLVFHADKAVITIGRDAQNQICYPEPFVSSFHARLTLDGDTWSIEDCNSANGTFVNGLPVKEQALRYGDIVSILGLRIVIGSGCIALNDPGGRLRINVQGAEPAKIGPCQPPEDEKGAEQPGEEKYYSLSPRFKREIEPRTFKVDPPPQNQIGQEMPMALAIGSTASMGMMSVVMLVSAAASGNALSMVSGGAMMVGSLLMPIVTRTYERRKKREREGLRQEKYAAYLDGVRRDIAEECEKQADILRENFVPVSQCETDILRLRSTLWNHDASQNDFLVLRAGRGEDRLRGQLQYAERQFTLDDDDLQQMMFQLGETQQVLRDVPVTVDLCADWVTGILGGRALTQRFVEGLIFQLAAFYSYDEVKMVFVYDRHKTDLTFVKWLPHVWNRDMTVRLLATDQGEVRTLSAYFENVIAEREQQRGDERKVLPHYVIFDFDKRLSDSSDMLKQLLAKQKQLGVSIVSVREVFSDLPRECTKVVQLTDEQTAQIFDRSDISGEVKTITPDIFLTQEPMEMSRRLANVKLRLPGQSGSMPKMISFLEMYGVGKVEHLNPAARWNENDPTKTLQAPVGVDAAGELFYLDLHEKSQGPHGLIAGMTGSGKSEFIITYILSMAINYRPEEVAFLLIDYKGGGLAGAFEDSLHGVRLPHLVGTITNLDGAAVKRSLISIESELRRRQAIFNDARRISNEGTMDIYKYQQLYRQHVVSEPVPHLFIISDEFAELKTQQPEFMEQLVSAARIGRSLGVHLILATQKPAGVVDDQIWSNSRFRVCLKVQDRSDSMDMIKRPEAASLVETGRFYLQVGFNEQFALGQSAWCGAPYYPSDRPETHPDNSIRVIDRTGRALYEVKPESHKSSGMEKKQIVSIVEYLSDLAEAEGIAARQLWLEPIPALIYTDALCKKYDRKAERYVLDPVVGEYDDPYSQQQRLMTVPLSEEGNVLIYGSTGSGKELLLHSMIYSLLTEHGPEEVNMYLVDLGAETLFSYSEAPHVGDVLFSGDREKMVNLFRMLQEECALRKRKFMPCGGSYQMYIRAAGEEPVPCILVVINNFSAFIDTFQSLEEPLETLLREGPKYGIVFAVTEASASGVRYRMQQSFKQMLVLQMNDETDYTGVLGHTDGVTPSKLYGRGIVRYDKIYEFQTAHTTEEDNVISFNRELSARLAAQTSVRARPVPILPDVVDADFVAACIRGLDAVPVGVNADTLRVETLDLQKSSTAAVLAQEGEAAADFARGLAEVLTRMPAVKTVVLDPEQLLERSCPGQLLQSGLEEYMGQLIQEVADRHNAYKSGGREAVRDRQETVCILLQLDALCGRLSEDGRDKLRLILEKSEAAHRMHFVVCDGVNEYNNATSTLFGRRKNVSDGIWLGDGIDGQFTLETRGRVPAADMSQPSFGYLVRKGRPSRVKFLEGAQQEKEEQDDE